MTVLETSGDEIMYAFTYHRPATARQAAGLLAKKEEAKLLAGGHTLLPTMKQRLAAPGALVDLAGCADLKGIERKGRNIVIGAMTTHAEVGNSPIVQEAIPALAWLAGNIGDPHVRHRGTIGGSVANNDPAADYPAACLALGATIVTNKRKIVADEFFTGLYETALEEGEIITRISFPLASKAGYAKFRNPASRYALVGVFVAKRGSDVRIAVTGAGEGGVFRWPEGEAALKTRFAPKSLDGVKHTADGINADMHADAEYRAHLIGVMAKDAVARATAK
jgi:carbon-monoxide dehydrogenase medium subunit